MSLLPSNASSSLLDWIDDVPPSIKSELKNRYDELTALEAEQVQMGTSTPQLYGSLSRFVANPSTVSVETYKRMQDTDDTVGSGIDFLNLSLIARFGDYKHPSQEVQAFVRRAINQMEGSWHQNLDEMLSAEWNGFSVTEQQWHNSPDFDGYPAFVPKKLVTYPPLTLVFAVNRHGEVLPDGIYQYQRFHNTFYNSYVYGIRNGDLDGYRPDLFASIGDYPYPIRIAADLTYLTVKIPKEKCIHLVSSSTGKFNNPYGRSILRRAYKHWVSKDAYLKMRLVAMDRKGTPLMVGYAAPNDTVLETVGPNHDPHNPNHQAQRADLAMNTIFKTLHNSSFITLPGRKGETYEIEAIQVQGDMIGFKDAIDDCNRGIMRSLLLPPLVLGGDGGGSYSLGQEHNRIWKQVVDGKNKVYKQDIIDQFIRKIVLYNFPQSAHIRDGFGEFLLEDYDPEVMTQLASVFRELTESGYMSPSAQEDFDMVRQKMGAPKRLAPAEMISTDPGQDFLGQSDPEKSDEAGTPEVPGDRNFRPNTDSSPFDGNKV
jgi:hypothetical protein